MFSLRGGGQVYIICTYHIIICTCHIIIDNMCSLYVAEARFYIICTYHIIIYHIYVRITSSYIIYISQVADLKEASFIECVLLQNVFSVHSALLAAARNNDLELIKTALSRGANVYAQVCVLFQSVFSYRSCSLAECVLVVQRGKLVCPGVCVCVWLSICMP